MNVGGVGGVSACQWGTESKRKGVYRCAVHVWSTFLGLTPLTGTGTILIIVDDVNDNRPMFDDDELSAFISEDAPLGTTFARFTALDKDVGVNGEIRYLVYVVLVVL